MATDEYEYENDEGDPTEDEIEDLKKQTLLFIQFRRALEEGDGVTAGKSLRQLPEIQGYLKDVLADMLEGSPNLEAKFHWFLQFVGRSKGPPPFTKYQERELEELAWKTVNKHLAQIHNLKKAWGKAAQELNRSEGSIKKYYYKRKRRNLGDSELTFNDPDLL
jgi:hypothetical protein